MSDDVERLEDFPTEDTPAAESGDVVTRNLSPEYIYTTPTNVENFGDVPFSPINKQRNDLSPPEAFKPRKPQKPKGSSPFCEDNPNDPNCISDAVDYCRRNPSDPRCNDETNVYKDLALFSEQVRYIFDPSKRSDENVTKKPVSTLYESKQDNVQMKPTKIIRSECRCKDGRVVLGYLDTSTGQKDCSPCQNKGYSNPNLYKNYKTKKRRTEFTDKKVPLRQQVGTSHFGDVNMKGCQTGNAEQSLESVNAVSTLNKVINTDTIDSRGGATITATKNVKGLPITLYDDASMNVYQI